MSVYSDTFVFFAPMFASVPAPLVLRTIPVALFRSLLLAVVSAVVVPPGAASADAPAQRIPRWGRFELVVSHALRSGDPYRDASLDVTYTAPDGRTVAFWGFYDGGDTWRARFMPDVLGTWKYEAKLNQTTRTDPSGSATSTQTTATLRGSFECVASDLPGQISVHGANPQWFGWRGSDTALIRALHVGDRFFARNWDEAKRTAFLDWAQQQGYNTLSIASHYLNRNAPGRGRDWETPKLWPLDAAEYQRMERILDDLARRRIIVFPFAGFFGRASEFPGAHSEQTRYLRYTLGRLAASWNLLWNVGGPEPLLRNNPYLTFEEVNRLGTEIARLDPFKHPISVHNFTGDDPFRDQPWLTFGTLQGPKTFDRAKLRDGLLRNHHPQKPLLAQETLWSGNSVHIRANKGADYSDADLRKNAYVIHFSAASLVFADNDGDSSTGFSGTMDLADRRQPRHDIVKRVWDTVASLPWSRTTPHPDVVQVAGGKGHAFCLALPGHTYLAYLESPLLVNVSVTPGSYDVTWINAQNATDRRRGELTRDGANLKAPSDGDDWILLLSRSAVPADPKPKNQP
jgi:hypothetical protein